MDRLIAGALLLAATCYAVPSPDAARRDINPPTEKHSTSATSTGIGSGIGSLIINAFNGPPAQDASPTSTAATSAPTPEATTCGDIVDAYNSNREIIPLISRSDQLNQG